MAASGETWCVSSSASVLASGRSLTPALASSGSVVS
eukprot:CAMPEP_0171082990 /NCGR_PEP_ID=MMETSP0766_2-20121228/17448_1 /TAXON_ID=439317 /ORGANISM="Gambierdiscus australes, Strain CAWD 149" /LENGTH=35 /DNA_ID= /DNA_START= /DNA_END= /DNA_ORIENTATION=